MRWCRCFRFVGVNNERDIVYKTFFLSLFFLGVILPVAMISAADDNDEKGFCGYRSQLKDYKFRNTEGLSVIITKKRPKRPRKNSGDCPPFSPDFSEKPTTLFAMYCLTYYRNGIPPFSP